MAIEAAKWIAAFATLGHHVRTVAGEGVADIIIPGLAIDATTPPIADELRARSATPTW